MDKAKYSPEQLASLMEEHMGLVVLLAHSFHPRCQSELDEYVQLGRIGVWKAIIAHDPSKAKLTTVIWWYVRWEIIRFLEKEKKHNNQAQINEQICEGHTQSIPLWEIIPDYLDDKEKDVIKFRLEGYTFEDIGKRMGYSRGWANNIFKTAIQKIEHANEKTDLNVQ